jgi:uncharacterized protein
MMGQDSAGPPGDWLGALARIAAFAGLAVALRFLLGAGWSLLQVPATSAWVFAGTAVVAAAALIAGAVMIRLADGRPAAALGLALSRDAAYHVMAGLAIGAVALALAAAGMLAAGSLRYAAVPGTVGDWAGAVLSHAGIFAVAALAEEAIFRGYAFQVLVRSAGPVAATTISSALFAAAHAANPEVGALALLNIFLAGVLLAVAYLRTLSLWFATAVHLGWNWAQASLFDLPVSGIDIFETPLYHAAVRGPDWWSGGAFGPEGGLVGTLGFGAALLLVLRLRRIRRDPRIARAGALVLDRERGRE